ncbi:hypothetical protein JK207_00575 [Gluconobacter cerinus]|uniref:hypothetical protein n=1 Tax=Gluconobacter cerinus TaxID=38307 RepID=UPI001B8B8689|nr:hypothetical protein [Gluconobacter cerinus]MBS1020530.1 hypothetical protein [Gluconobacter cerinus]
MLFGKNIIVDWPKFLIPHTIPGTIFSILFWFGFIAVIMREHRKSGPWFFTQFFVLIPLSYWLFTKFNNEVLADLDPWRHLSAPDAIDKEVAALTGRSLEPEMVSPLTIGLQHFFQSGHQYLVWPYVAFGSLVLTLMISASIKYAIIFTYDRQSLERWQKISILCFVIIPTLIVLSILFLYIAAILVAIMLIPFVFMICMATFPLIPMKRED